MAHKKTSDQISYNMSRIKNKNTAIELQFEEELKKFHPSLEVEDAEDAIYNQDLTDMADLLVKMIKESEEKESKEV